jgi:hypothetical protein
VPQPSSCARGNYEDGRADDYRKFASAFFRGCGWGGVTHGLGASEAIGQPNELLLARRRVSRAFRQVALFRGVRADETQEMSSEFTSDIATAGGMGKS